MARRRSNLLQVQGYQIDYEDWHHDVHGLLPYNDLIHKDPELCQILQSLPYPKFIFTNADIKHARTVLGILGIEDLFEVCLLSLKTNAFIEVLSQATRNNAEG